MRDLRLTTTKIESSLVKGIDYYKGVLTLDLGSRLYAYNEVPFSLVLSMLESDSIGKFYNTYIKGSFESQELSHLETGS